MGTAGSTGAYAAFVPMRKDASLRSSPAAGMPSPDDKGTVRSYDPPDKRTLPALTTRRRRRLERDHDAAKNTAPGPASDTAATSAPVNPGNSRKTISPASTRALRPNWTRSSARLPGAILALPSPPATGAYVNLVAKKASGTSGEADTAIGG